jgi:uncharacterized protein (TIGR02118 family)
MLYMVSAFDFRIDRFTLEQAGRHYLEHHVPLARRLPGLRRYVIGPLAATRTIPAARSRGAILAFDSLEGLRAAYASPVGRDLRADEERLIAEPRTLLIAGEEVL